MYGIHIRTTCRLNLLVLVYQLVRSAAEGQSINVCRTLGKLSSRLHGYAQVRAENKLLLGCELNLKKITNSLSIFSGCTMNATSFMEISANIICCGMKTVRL